MKKIAEVLLDALYPRCCPLCHQVLENPEELLCPGCRETLRPVTGARCMKCGRPVEEEREFCPQCKEGRRSFDQGLGIFPYDGIWRRSMVRFKYYGCREYGDFYARAMCFYGKKQILRWRPSRIVPVPVHPGKRRSRGFNQAEYLARRIGWITGIPVDEGLVVKTKKTKSQKKLSASQRQKNLREAFQVRERVDGLRILVIDDVYTTGSTMDAMARCLKEKGAVRVYFITVCTGRI
ncbi:MAG: ComF family protein [Clostridiales bacterium]|nr:ComF family protein [Clostridiales bacterium]